MPLRTNTLPSREYKIESICGSNPEVIKASYHGQVRCPDCDGVNLRKKDRYIRKLRHESRGTRRCELRLRGYKFRCNDCGRYFHQRFPGILPYKRSTEGFRREVFEKHFDGICQSRLAQRLKIGTATVERWFHEFLDRKLREMKNNPCPVELGIDEHFFTRKAGYHLQSYWRRTPSDPHPYPHRIQVAAQKRLGGYYSKRSHLSQVSSAFSRSIHLTEVEDFHVRFA